MGANRRPPGGRRPARRHRDHAGASVVLVLLALASAACGGPGAGDDTSAKDGTVSVQFFGDATEAELYREIAEEFTRRTRIRVELVPVADRDSHLAKLTTGFAAGRAPDVFLLDYRNFGPFQSRGVLQPVAKRLEASRVLRPQDLYRAPVDAFTADGALQCLPRTTSGLVVYFNRELLDEAGLEAPQAGWTYTDFLLTARTLRDRLRRTAPERSAAVGVDPGLIRLAPFVWSAGGELTDSTERPKRFTFDSPATRTGLGRFLALYREGLTPSEAAVEARGLDEQFAAGDLGMFLSSREEVPAFRRIDGFDWDVAAFPRAEREVSVLHSDAYCVARGGDADLGWRFAEFAGGPAGQRVLARGGGVVPSLERVATSGAFTNPARAPGSSEVFLAAIPTLRRLPNTREWPRIEDAASLAFKRAFYDELSVQAAIDRIEAETAGLF